MTRPDIHLLELVLKDLSERSIAQFAAEHPDKAFYGFGFDCNASYGDVLLCVNTEADFAKCWAEYVAKWSYGPGDFARIRRDFGAWEYQGFNLYQDAWRELWAPHQESVRRYLEDADDDFFVFVEEFLRMVCRVLIRLEQSGALACLHRDDGFFTLVMDHDEDEEEGSQRLSTERARFIA